jgi:hypothetical protein
MFADADTMDFKSPTLRIRNELKFLPMSSPILLQVNV